MKTLSDKQYETLQNTARQNNIVLHGYNVNDNYINLQNSKKIIVWNTMQSLIEQLNA